MPQLPARRSTSCTSTAWRLRKTPEALRMIEGARARGLDITTEAYPYIAGSTRLESALFEPGLAREAGR